MKRKEQTPSTGKWSSENKIVQSGRFRGDEIVLGERNHLEPEELNAFWDQVRPSPFWYPYFFIQYFYGCRVSEPALILKEDLSFKTKEILLRRLKKKGKTGFKEDVVPMTKGVKVVLRQILEWGQQNNHGENPWLFPSPRKSNRLPKERLGQIRRLDNGYSSISRMSAHSAFKTAAKGANIPEHLRHSHVLRHTRATLMLAQGYEPLEVKTLLGHSHINITYQYMGVAEQLRKNLHNRLETEVLPTHFFRQTRRRSAELSRSAYSVEDSEFSAEPFEVDE